jgi:hypothetical protein
MENINYIFDNLVDGALTCMMYFQVSNIIIIYQNSYVKIGLKII